VKLGFASGDHTLNAALSTLTLFYLFFLTEVAGLRPALASLILLLGRFVDAFTDPAMGRISDRTSWRLGRRRPYFVIGAIPFGLSVALLFQPIPVESQAVKFGIYVAAYVFHSLAYTVLAVPYMALLPEMALGYQERTSLNTYRSAAAVLGTLLVAVAFQPLIRALGGGAAGFASAAICLGIWLTLPWILVHRITWERPEFSGRARIGLIEGAKQLIAHHAYRRLVGLYICARSASDLIGAMFLLYFAYWLRRADDFSVTMAVLLCAVIFSLPAWLRVSRSVDKRNLFIFGALWWVGAQTFLLLAAPTWPRWTIFAVAAAAGIGYAMADLMPWSMLGDVIDEDELNTGERREGIYAGFFTFLRKLGGATGVLVAGVVLDLAGHGRASEGGEPARQAIRVLTAVAPACFLALGAWIARGYPISRKRHAEILQELGRA
jgi:sugar (glycoside-pentoside-hexuronide) transporter